MSARDPAAVDELLASLLAGPDRALDAARERGAAAGLPAHEVSSLQGRLLRVLAEACGAVRVLELGTLAGVSTIELARAVRPDGGAVVTLEVDPRAAAVAEANVAAAGVGDRVDIRIGPALGTLSRLRDQGAEPFDLAFLDADKEASPDYLEPVMALLRPGGVLVADNVVRGGAVADPGPDDPSARGVRRLIELVAAHPRLDATVIQTVGAKGHDGFLLAIAR